MTTPRRILPLLAALAAALILAAPAGAATELTVTAGVDGAYVAGEPVVLLVEIQADQLISGELRVSSEDTLAQRNVAVPVEVPGGGAKSYRVMVGSGHWEPPRLTVQVVDRDQTLASERVTVRSDVADELVGVLPRLAERTEVPDNAELTAGEGRARFATLDAAWLDLGRDGLGLFGTVVGTEADLAELSDDQRDEIMAWVYGGGTLLVDSAPGTALAALGPEAQPGDAERVRVGSGFVRFSDGDAGAGRWDGLIFPSPKTTAGADGDIVSEQNFGGFSSISASLSADAGFRLPDSRSLMLMLGAYLLLAGPGVYFLVRAVGRPTLTWLLLPVLAAGFTGVVYLQGEELRRSSGSAHTTVLEVTPYGSRYTSHLLVGSRNGGDVAVQAPVGWRAEPFVDPWMNPWMFDMGGPVPEMRATAHPDRTQVDFSLDPGAFEGLRLSGTTEESPGVEVAAWSSEHGTVGVTVTNQLSVTLHEVGILIEDAGEPLGSLEPGESRDIELTRVGAPADMSIAHQRIWEDVGDPWMRDDMVFDQFGNPVLGTEGGPVDPSAWQALVVERGHNLQVPGEVLVVGWTRDLPLPVTQDGQAVSAGRTAVLARGLVEARGPRLSDAVASRSLVSANLPGQGMFGPAQPPGDERVPFQGIVRFALPDAVDGRPVDLDALVLDLPEHLRGAALLLDDRWLDLFAGIGGRKIVDLPAESIHHGSIYVRVDGLAVLRRRAGSGDPTVYELGADELPDDMELTTVADLEERARFFAAAREADAREAEARDDEADPEAPSDLGDGQPQDDGSPS